MASKRRMKNIRDGVFVSIPGLVVAGLIGLALGWGDFAVGAASALACGGLYYGLKEFTTLYDNEYL